MDRLAPADNARLWHLVGREAEALRAHQTAELRQQRAAIDTNRAATVYQTANADTNEHKAMLQHRYKLAKDDQIGKDGTVTRVVVQPPR